MERKMDCINIININIQSVCRKIDQLELLLVDNKVDVLCMPEHWLKTDQLKSFCINHYIVCGCHSRSNIGGGGALILIREQYAGVPLDDICSMSLDEQVEVTAANLNRLNIVVISIYRPPTGDLKLLHKGLHNILNYIMQELDNHKIYLAGDFNIDFSRYCKSKADLIQLFHMFGLDLGLQKKLQRV